MKYTKPFVAMIKFTAQETLKELYRGDFSSGNGKYTFSKEGESVIITEEGYESYIITYQDIRKSIDDVYHTRLEWYETHETIFSDCALAYLLNNYPDEAEKLFN